MNPEFFWNKIEKELNVPIYIMRPPNHIKFVFKLQGLDFPATLETVTSSIIPDLETFVGSEDYFNAIPSGSDLRDYFGLFFENRKSFKFLLGEKNLLKIILDSQIFKQSSFWQIDTSKNVSLSECKYKHSLTKILLETDQMQLEKVPNAYRYPHEFKLFCAYIRMTGGAIAYESMSKNLGMPSISTMNRFIRNNAKPVIEGECRFNDLREFLDKRNLPRFICVSEDATRITGRIQYKKDDNEVVGFVLPLNQTTSMPESHHFKATSFDTIENYFNEETRSNLLYTFIAQTLQKDSPSFCFNLFGTNNSFTYLDVLKRRKYITEEMRKVDIHVLGYSSDGDPRLLKAMRIKANLGSNNLAQFTIGDTTIYLPEFHAALTTFEVFMQDLVHLLNKWKNRFLKFSILLPLVNFRANRAHLQMLIDTVPKDKHFLTEKDLNNKDKMNFAATLKICDTKVIEALKKYVPDSCGTQMYLRLMNDLSQAFLNTDLKVSQRLHYT